jgi:hypothetical protein
MKILLLLAFPFLLIFSLKHNELEKNFTKDEIADLEKLSHFFKTQMCGDNQNFQTCMDSLIPILGEFGWQPILKNINFDEQEKLYQSFESDLFPEIWDFCKVSNRERTWTKKSLCANTNGKYISFLKDLGKRNEVLNAYKNSILAAGDFVDMQRLEYQIFKKTKWIDLNDPAIQILISIDYLTQNDQQKRNDAWIVK